MAFSAVYQNLEPEKTFDTIWASLPENIHNRIKQILKPIKTYCHWCAVIDPKRIPHVTLRYLGYHSPELQNQMIQDKNKFTAAAKEYLPIKTTLGEIGSWESPDPRQLRVYWKINSSSIRRLHQDFLKIDNYSFFTSLEGANFNPHITLSRVNLAIPYAEENVTAYFEKLRTAEMEFEITTLELNFVPSLEENFQVKL